MTRSRILIGNLFLLLTTGLWAQQKPSQVIPSLGEVHIPVVILEFSDVHFTLEEPLQHFQDMLNLPGYSVNGATGSVRDYFTDNSHNLFTPVFDVYGPVTLDKRMAYYGKDIIRNGERVDDTAPEEALLDACRLLDEVIDFSQYDKDEDGLVDLCIYYFAGRDQAEGGPADAIWSHHWDIQDALDPAVRDAVFDEVKLGAYFCSAELGGANGDHPMGIGISCHELAHALGLPDFYDANEGQDGYAGGLYDFSLMCRGLYNNEDRTPPYLNALERMLLGWIPEIPELPESGEVLLGPVQQNLAYRIPTQTEGEFFLVESRDGTVWDAPLPEGLLVYHVDRSERTVGETPAIELWNNWRKHNGINNLGSHPCFYIIPSSDLTSLNYGSAFLNSSALVFPGSSRQLAYEPLDWEGEWTGVQLTCIESEKGLSRFRVVRNKGSQVSGIVRNTAGRPVSDVTISVDGSSAYVKTSPEGFFVLPLEGEGPFTLKASKNGYLDASVPFGIKEGSRIASVMLEMRTPGDAEHTALEKFDPEKASGAFNESVAIGAVRFTAPELCKLGGRLLTEVVCYPYIVSQDEELGDMYVTVDFGPVRVLNKKVENPTLGEFRRIVVDLREENLRIPEGLDIYIGYGFEKATGNTPLSVVYPGNRGNSYWSQFSLEKSSWAELYSSSRGMYLDLMLSASAGEVPAISLDRMGYAYIDSGKDIYRTGERFTPTLKVPQHIRVREVQWMWDGNVLSSSAFSLSKGDHLLVAKVTYEDGRREKIQTMVRVKD